MMRDVIFWSGSRVSAGRPGSPAEIIPGMVRDSSHPTLPGPIPAAGGRPPVVARAAEPGEERTWGPGRVGFWAALTLLAAAGVAGPWLRDRLQLPSAAGAWTTVFVSVCLQSLPFLLLGVALSAVVTVALPVERLLRLLPSHPLAAVPVAGAAGVVLPGCECASVPVAAGLIRRGVPSAAALTFLLAAPAVNPVVLVSTSVAFPGRPDVVIARFVASLAAAVVIGWLWVAFGQGRVPLPVRRAGGHGGDDGFLDVMRHDLLHAGGFVILGAMLAATVNVVLPRSWLEAVGEHPWAGVLVLAAVAVLVAICSEADAFVAASFTQFSPTAQLTFMVVGPMVDVKLISLQAGTFGRRFVLWFAPVTLVIAILASVLVGGWLE